MKYGQAIFHNNSYCFTGMFHSISTDYKHGYAVGSSLAKNLSWILNGSKLFEEGFFDGYHTMNVTKSQWR
jgi:hypothetical protein